MIKSRKITAGTKEWADSNVNCYFGCSNDCRYCYAKKMAVRFNRKTKNDWKTMVPNQKTINKKYLKRKGRIMFPTSHDITEVSLENCLVVLKKLFTAQNSVLITTKPSFKCVKRICDNLARFRPLIQFRFTITSKKNDLLKFWEPNAPSFEERVESLKYAYEKGFKTSVSIEPFLDEDPYDLVEIFLPYTTESIWIGKMNYVMFKTKINSDSKYYDFIRKINSKENLEYIVKNAQNYSDNIIRIKDSIYNYLNINDF